MIQKQREHFQGIHDKYQDHYYDRYSNYYREKIIITKIKNELRKNDKILEVGCGGGSNFRTFSKLGLINGKYHAIDISPKAVENFNEIVSSNKKKYHASVANFAEQNLDLGEKFSLILFIGVLHHMTNDLEEVFKNIDTNLEEHGSVIFVEPNANFLNSIRKIWYLLSDNFDHYNERALTAKEICFFAKQNNLQLDKINYIGNIGFFVILQSMILKTPKWLKRATYIPLTFFDLWIEKFKSKYCLSSIICIYRRPKK
jgi:SAM-dependent methyltransferase